MTGEREMLVEFIDSLKASSNISFGDNSKGKELGLGKVVISNDLSLSNVMLVQSLHYNLLGNVVISKKILRTRKIMVMHSNEREECCPRTLVDR